jgi:hypothetical protein
MDCGDVGMVQAGQQLGFTFEALQPFLVGGQGLRQDLDRDLSIEGRVQRPPDHTHPTLADLLDDAVVQQVWPD